MENISFEPTKIILKKCMELRPEESCLIITDKTRLNLSKKVLASARQITESSEIMLMPELENNGSEPTVKVAHKMLKFDVILILTSKSMSHTKARLNATNVGARIASMPGITKEILNRAIDVDYKEMSLRTNLIADMLDNSKNVRITTALGTKISFSIKGRKAHGRKSGIYNKPSYWGNLPEGEAFIAPVEGSANGKYIVDASQAGIGKLKEPITIHVKNGYAYDFSGDRAIKLQEFLKKFKDKNAFNIAEFGIGTNNKAIITGNVLEDEKVFGTCHIALGNNFGFGGQVNIPVHVDGIIDKPTIILDGKVMMKYGILKKDLKTIKL